VIADLPLRSAASNESEANMIAWKRAQWIARGLIRPRPEKPPVLANDEIGKARAIDEIEQSDWAVCAALERGAPWVRKALRTRLTSDEIELRRSRVIDAILSLGPVGIRWHQQHGLDWVKGRLYRA
jgi:hypothetical protein